MSRIKPVYVMNEEGLSDLVKRAVLDGVKEVLRIGEVDGLIDVIDLGVWKSENYEDYLDRDGSLKEYQSVDWYLQEARKRSRDKNRIDASTLLNLLELPHPFKKHSVLVLHSDIYRQDGRSIVGLARLGGSEIVLSTNKLKDLDEETKCGCIKTAAMHEAGHNYGLVPYRTGVDYTHCANKCVMRPGSCVPDDLITMTNDRLKHGALCQECETDLKEWFKEKPSTSNGKPIILQHTRRN